MINTLQRVGKLISYCKALSSTWLYTHLKDQVNLNWAKLRKAQLTWVGSADSYSVASDYQFQWYLSDNRDFNLSFILAKCDSLNMADSVIPGKIGVMLPMTCLWLYFSQYNKVVKLSSYLKQVSGNIIPTGWLISCWKKRPEVYRSYLSLVYQLKISWRQLIAPKLTFKYSKFISRDSLDFLLIFFSYKVSNIGFRKSRH